MSELLTDEQFERALNISIQCARKKWQHTTDMKIANIIAKAKNKEEAISKIEEIIKLDNEKTVLNMMMIICKEMCINCL